MQLNKYYVFFQTKNYQQTAQHQELELLKKIYDFEKCHTSKTPNPLSGRNTLEEEECIKKCTKRYQKIKPTIYELLG